MFYPVYHGSMNRAIFLDRDGVINQTIFRDGKPRAPYTRDDFRLYDGAAEAVRDLKSQGYFTIIVTNQPDVARGWVKEEAVHLINQLITQAMPIDAIKICFHTEMDNCSCRKPMPGMLLEAAKEFNLELNHSYMLGDRYSDIQAGQAAGCHSILIGEGDRRPEELKPFQQFSSLADASQWILRSHA